jgi:hypothetical protein
MSGNPKDPVLKGVIPNSFDHIFLKISGEVRTLKASPNISRPNREFNMLLALLTLKFIRKIFEICWEQNIRKNLK